jgi:hypothetical protein
MAQRLSTSFKVIVISSGLLVAAYTYKLFTGTKQTIIAEPTIVAENQPVKKHHKKHKLKNHLAIAKKLVLKNDTVKEVTPQIVTVPKPEPVKAVVPNIVTVPKSAPVKQAIETNNNFLYTTYVHPNVTGIVKLRQEDKFSSSFIADIPANAKVQVLQKGEMYYRVAYNNSIGFVPKWALQDK